MKNLLKLYFYIFSIIILNFLIIHIEFSFPTIFKYINIYICFYNYRSPCFFFRIVINRFILSFSFYSIIYISSYRTCFISNWFSDISWFICTIRWIIISSYWRRRMDLLNVTCSYWWSISTTNISWRCINRFFNDL